MEKELIVVGLEKYRFPNKDTGEIIEGAKIHFLEQSDRDNHFGYLPRSLNVNSDFELIYDLPAVCKAEFSLDFSYKRPTTKLKKLVKERDFDLEVI